VKVVVHLSDPHFGTEDPVVAAALLDELGGAGGQPTPALIVISGDLTQRAKDEQFRAARAFLDALPAPHLVVPGNHDIPLYDLWSRFAHPLRRYRALISDELMPCHVDDELVAVGLTTAHGLTVKDGKVTAAQAEVAAALLAAHPDRFKIVVAHHPFVLPAGRPARERVDGAEVATPILRDAGVEVICSGHLHVAYASDTAGFRDQTREIVAVHAGTCMSTRLRGEPNGYNRLILDGDLLTIQQRRWAWPGFVDGPHKRYRRDDGHWLLTREDAAA
jgi:3',5'-cyclic AMP phosphodiesterase CpdA